MAWKEKRRIMQRYNASAEMYDEWYGEEQNRKYLKALQNLDAADKMVLDVGCGSGLFFPSVAPKAQLVIGVDVSRKLLLKAKQHAKAFGNCFVVQADADRLPFRDGFFGAVFAFTVLQNMPKPAQTLTELRRVVAADGRVVVTGLKKAFPLTNFLDILEGSGMQLASFVDEESVNCYVAILRAA